MTVLRRDAVQQLIQQMNMRTYGRNDDPPAFCANLHGPTREKSRRTKNIRRNTYHGLLPNAGKQAHTHLHGVLDAQRTALATEIAKARTDVLTVEGKTVKTDIETQKMTFDDFVEAADYAVIEDAYKRAARLISPDLAKTYSEHLADQNADAEDYEEALIEAHTDVAALGLVDTIKAKLESEAEALANEWLTAHEAAIKGLTDEREDVYRELREGKGQRK